MVTTSGDSSGRADLYNNVQSTTKFEHPAPEGSLLLDILKTMEVQFQRRGYLPEPQNGSFHPLFGEVRDRGVEELGDLYSSFTGLGPAHVLGQRRNGDGRDDAE